MSLSVIARSNYDAVKQDGLKIDSDVHGKCDVNIDHGTINGFHITVVSSSH